MKVLHLLKSNSYSGAENVAITLINSLNKYYPDEYTSIYACPEGPIREYLFKNNIAFFTMENFNINTVNKAIKKINPQIIHAHDFTASVIASYATKKIPIISHLHNNPSWIENLNIRTMLYKMRIKYFRKILGVSDSIFNEFYFSAIQKNAKVIGNPIDISAIMAKAITNTNEKYDIVFIGRLTEQKNPQRFIEIMEGLININPLLTGAMLGDGELKKECTELINKKGLEKQIVLKGFVAEPFSILKNSAILCIPSRWEGFGLVAVEALTFGKPVLATPVGGLVDIIVNDVGGVFTTNEGFIKEANRLISDENYYKSKSIAATKRAQELNNIESYTTEIVGIYSEVLINPTLN